MIDSRLGYRKKCNLDRHRWPGISIEIRSVNDERICPFRFSISNFGTLKFDKMEACHAISSCAKGSIDRSILLFPPIEKMEH